jgi:hypothetical protein
MKKIWHASSAQGLKFLYKTNTERNQRLAERGTDAAMRLSTIRIPAHKFIPSAGELVENLIIKQGARQGV